MRGRSACLHPAPGHPSMPAVHAPKARSTSVKRPQARERHVGLAFGIPAAGDRRGQAAHQRLVIVHRDVGPHRAGELGPLDQVGGVAAQLRVLPRALVGEIDAGHGVAQAAIASHVLRRCRGPPTPPPPTGPRARAPPRRLRCSRQRTRAPAPGPTPPSWGSGDTRCPRRHPRARRSRPSARPARGRRKRCGRLGGCARGCDERPPVAAGSLRRGERCACRTGHLRKV